MCQGLLHDDLDAQLFTAISNKGFYLCSNCSETICSIMDAENVHIEQVTNNNMKGGDKPMPERDSNRVFTPPRPASRTPGWCSVTWFTDDSIVPVSVEKLVQVRVEKPVQVRVEKPVQVTISRPRDSKGHFVKIAA